RSCSGVAPGGCRAARSRHDGRRSPRPSRAAARASRRESSACSWPIIAKVLHVSPRAGEGESPSPGQFAKSPEIARLGLLGWPRRQVLALERRRKGRLPAEEALRLGGRKAGEPRRLEIGGRAVRRLD